MGWKQRLRGAPGVQRVLKLRQARDPRVILQLRGRIYLRLDGRQGRESSGALCALGGARNNVQGVLWPRRCVQAKTKFAAVGIASSIRLIAQRIQDTSMAPRTVSISVNTGPDQPPVQNQWIEQNNIDPATFSQTLLLPKGHASISGRPDTAASVGNLPIKTKPVRKLQIHWAILL